MFSEKRANHIVQYINLLKHTGDFYGKPFNLMPWQEEIVRDVYGTVKPDGYRQYRFAYLEVPKKNGKTELIGAISTYHLNCSLNEEIYCCAADREQASLIYKAAKTMLLQDEYFYAMWERGDLKILDSKKKIENRKTHSVLQVLSAEAYTKHGINPTLVIFDELHAQPSRDLWDVMTFGAGAARKEPLWWIITTAGDDPDRKSIGWEQHEYADKLINGEIVDPTWYAKIYAAKETDDIWDEATWYKANPSLGITIDIEAVRAEAETAKNKPMVEKNFRWLRLNQWVSLKQQGWLPLTLFDENCEKEFDINILNGKIGYQGYDLSSTGDLTANTKIFPKQPGVDKLTVVFKGYIPDVNMKERERTDKIPYSQWVKDGYITATPGDVIDYNYIKSDIRNDSLIYKMKGYGADPWNGEKLRQDLLLKQDLSSKDANKYPDIEVLAVPQNLATFTPTMKEIERLVRSHEIRFVFNPCARWCFGNLKIWSDGNENIKPVKISKRLRIDMMVAFFNAFYIYSKNKDKTSVYEKRGVLAL